jgi:RNA polymerase sigma-70 factor (ECF subfamily)
MLEDKLLVWKLRYGNQDALRRIYEKYKNDLLALAIALSNDKSVAEDAVHDVFVSFAQFAGKLQLRNSLKSYLSTCIANRVRDLNRAKPQQTVHLVEAEVVRTDSNRPERLAMSAEESRQISVAMAQLPYEQREVIILHLQGGMTFKAIARSMDVSINTVQSRYRYGLDKLQSVLDGEVKNETCGEYREAD